MAKAHATWKVLEHGPLEQTAENLWRVEGAVPGVSLRRVMTVARRGDGGLVVWNPICLDAQNLAAFDALGAPAVLVVPNAIHRLDAPPFKARYPQARVVTPKGSRAKVEEVLAVDATTDAVERDDAVWFEPLGGVGDQECVMLVRSPDGVTVVLNDAVFNMDHRPDFLGRMVTTMLGSAPGPRVSRLAKMLLVKDKKALKADLERLAQVPGLVRLQVAHDKLARGPDAKAALEQAATYL